MDCVSRSSVYLRLLCRLCTDVSFVHCGYSSPLWTVCLCLRHRLCVYESLVNNVFTFLRGLCIYLSMDCVSRSSVYLRLLCRLCTDVSLVHCGYSSPLWTVCLCLRHRLCVYESLVNSVFTFLRGLCIYLSMDCVSRSSVYLRLCRLCTDVSFVHCGYSSPFWTVCLCLRHKLCVYESLVNNVFTFLRGLCIYLSMDCVSRSSVYLRLLCRLCTDVSFVHCGYSSPFWTVCLCLRHRLCVYESLVNNVFTFLRGLCIYFSVDCISRSPVYLRLLCRLCTDVSAVDCESAVMSLLVMAMTTTP